MKQNKNFGLHFAPISTFKWHALTSLKVLSLTMLLMFPLLCFSQGQPSVIRDWTMLGESSNHIDVSYRLVKCNISTPTQVHLMVLNENPTEQAVSIDVKITDNASGQHTIVSVEYAAAAAALVRASCDDASTAALKINIPAAYNASNLSLQVIFK